MIKKVDLVENNPKYIAKAKELLQGKNVEDFYCEGLESFKPTKIYDCIWIQWVFLLSKQIFKKFELILEKSRQF